MRIALLLTLVCSSLRGDISSCRKLLIEQAYTDALKVCSSVAATGDTEAQFYLGLMYANGRGVEPNLVQAHKWFSVSAVGGNTDAAKQRDTIAGTMTPQQLAESRTSTLRSVDEILREKLHMTPGEKARRSKRGNTGRRIGNVAQALLGRDFSKEASEEYEAETRRIAALNGDPGPAREYERKQQEQQKENDREAAEKRRERQREFDERSREIQREEQDRQRSERQDQCRSSCERQYDSCSQNLSQGAYNYCKGSLDTCRNGCKTLR